jgi:hypothetical protein
MSQGHEGNPDLICHCRNSNPPIADMLRQVLEVSLLDGNQIKDGVLEPVGVNCELGVGIKANAPYAAQKVTPDCILRLKWWRAGFAKCARV